METAAFATRFLHEQLFARLPVPGADFSGRTVIVTGSNSGLGLEAARHFARLQAATVVLGVRDAARGAAAADELARSTGRPRSAFRVWPLDLASFASVRAFAARARADLARLDVLLANAGQATAAFRLQEHNESTVTVNLLATFLLAFSLLPLLARTAARFPDQPRPCLSVVASDAAMLAFWAERHVALHQHHQARANQPQPQTEPRAQATLPRPAQGPAQGPLLARLADPAVFRYTFPDRYSTTKLLEVAVVREFARRFPAPAYPVTVNCLNPGLCYSRLFRELQAYSLGNALYALAMACLARSAEQGARCLVHAASPNALHPAAGRAANGAGPESHGAYLSSCAVVRPPAMLLGTQGARLQELLWDELAERLEAASPGIMAGLNP